MTITKELVLEQVYKFLQFCNNGQKASFDTESENGNMSVCLKNSRKTRNSPSRIKRNKARAETYRKEKQLQIGEDAGQLTEQFDFNFEDAFYINSDLNGNGGDTIDASKLSSNVDYILGSDNDYQFCFVDDEDCDDDCDIIRTRHLDTDLSISDQEEIQNEDDTDEAC